MISYTLDEITITEVHSKIVDSIIERNHYLGSVPACAKHRYLIVANLKGIIGAAMWARPAARHEDQEDTIELRRFWTEDNTPKNTESYCIARMLKDMGAYGYERVIAYSSTEHHQGTIYRACNFEMIGKTKGGKKDSWENRPGRKDRDTSQKMKFEYML